MVKFECVNCKWRKWLVSHEKPPPSIAIAKIPGPVSLLPGFWPYTVPGSTCLASWGGGGGGVPARLYALGNPARGMSIMNPVWLAIKQRVVGGPSNTVDVD